MFHIGGIQTLLRAVIVGDTLVMPRGKFDPTEALQLIEEWKVSQEATGLRRAVLELRHDRMPAGLHRDFLALSIDNLLVTPGHATALGVPVDLGKVTADAYVIGGETDHLTPWQSCYRSAGLLGGSTQFVLSTSGHIAALVNPPGNPKSSFRTATALSSSPGEFLASADSHEGSWWPHYAAWLAARTGECKRAPEQVGTTRHPPLAEAPGTYVFDT